MTGPGPVTGAARRALARTTPSGVPVARFVLGRQLARIFGARPAPPTQGDRGDPGLTGPGSPSWQVIGEPAAIAGGVRALLVQALHPLAVAGVTQHSAYRDDTLGRLSRTSAYVTTTAIGSTQAALAVTTQVRAQHRRVRGTAPDGRAYAADDPALLAWVSIAFTSSLLAADQLWSPFPLDAAAADGFVAEQSRTAALLDPRVDLDDAVSDPRSFGAAFRADEVALPLVDDGWLPTTVAGLAATLDRYRPSLAVGELGRSTLGFLRDPPLPPVARAGYRVLFAGAVGALEPWQRDLLGLGGALARLQVRRAGVALTAMRTVSGTSPGVRAARARVDAG
jgi:uncharacterized protein (DUF2236 family)